MGTTKNMLTAEQARIAAQANYGKRVQAEIDDIRATILSAINDGKMRITRSSYIYPETRKYLEDLGYIVEVQYNELPAKDHTVISW